MIVCELRVTHLHLKHNSGIYVHSKIRKPHFSRTSSRHSMSKQSRKGLGLALLIFCQLHVLGSSSCCPSCMAGRLYTCNNEFNPTQPTCYEYRQLSSDADDGNKITRSSEDNVASRSTLANCIDCSVSQNKRNTNI